jgi:hypothetical protein
LRTSSSADHLTIQFGGFLEQGLHLRVILEPTLEMSQESLGIRIGWSGIQTVVDPQTIPLMFHQIHILQKPHVPGHTGLGDAKGLGELAHTHFLVLEHL